MSAIFTLPQSSLFVPHTIGPVVVEHNGSEFFVVDSKEVRSLIQRVDLAKELRGISSQTLQKMLDIGYFSISKCGSEYLLRFDGRIQGGMFSPKSWGSGLAAFAGRGSVYKAGEVMGHSKLHVAATQGWIDDVKTFIQGGADVNMVNTKGNTPLDDAIRERHVAIEAVLRENGAKRSNELR